MLDVDDWADIRRLHFAEKLGIKTIARKRGVSRNTVRSAVRSGGPPSYDRPPKARSSMPMSRASASCCRTPRRCRRR